MTLQLLHIIRSMGINDRQRLVLWSSLLSIPLIARTLASVTIVRKINFKDRWSLQRPR